MLTALCNDSKEIFAALAQVRPSQSCRFCGKPAIFDKLCYGCWQVTTKLRIFLDSREGRRFVREQLNEAEDTFDNDEIPEACFDAVELQSTGRIYLSHDEIANGWTELANANAPNEEEN